jgi:hypothetical protein
MKTLSIRTILPLFGALFIAAASFTTDVQAEAEICWEQTVNGRTTTECEYVSVLRAECALTDPENRSDVCETATSNRPNPSDGTPDGFSLGQNGGQSFSN